MSSKSAINPNERMASSSVVARKSATTDAEDDIFMDKEELLKEKLDKLNTDVDSVCEEIRKLQSYNDWLTILIEDGEMQNHEILRFIEKKEDRRTNHSTTLSDFHAYNIEVLKRERDEILETFSEQKKALWEQLEEEQKTLDKCREELFQMRELKNIRKKQETEIEQLDKTARQLRTEFSQKVNQLKEDLQQMTNDLDRVGRIQLKQSQSDARLESIQLVIEKMQEMQSENCQLREQIWSTRENIRALEKHLDHVTEQHRELRRANIQATDLDYLEKRRLKGLLMLEQ